MEDLEITPLGGETGLSLAGELDRATTPKLNEALAGITVNGQVTLDLSELTFIDSSGLHAIVEYARAADGTAPVVLQDVPVTMLRIFEITNLTEHPNLEIRAGDGR